MIFFPVFSEYVLFITYRKNLKTTSSSNNIHLSAILIENGKLSLTLQEVILPNT